MVDFNVKEAVPPIRSRFPDFGPDPDFFVKSGPEMVRIYCKSPDFELLGIKTTMFMLLLLAIMISWHGSQLYSKDF